MFAWNVLKNVVKYYQPDVTEGLALSKGRKGGSRMLANDVILRLVEMLMEEKDKNCELKISQIQQQQPAVDEANKDYK